MYVLQLLVFFKMYYVQHETNRSYCISSLLSYIIFRTYGADGKETDIRQVAEVAEHTNGHYEQSHCDDRREEVVAYY